MIDEETLQGHARDAIQAGRLPTTRPIRVSAGNGFGMHCSICGNLVKPDEIGYELEFAADKGDLQAAEHHVHVQCLAAWDLARRSLFGLTGDADHLSVGQREGTILHHEPPHK